MRMTKQQGPDLRGPAMIALFLLSATSLLTSAVLAFHANSESEKFLRFAAVFAIAASMLADTEICSAIAKIAAKVFRLK
jgi:hypothetical protein